MPRKKPAAADPARPTVAIIGAGQMGLVCASILADPESGDRTRAGLPRPHVRVWGKGDAEMAMLAQTRRSDRLPGMQLPESVTVAMNAEEALSGADLVVYAVPVQVAREAWEAVARLVPRGAGVVSVSKGIENGTLLRPTQILSEGLRDDPDARPRPLAALSGPTIASELARCLPATMVAASDDEAFRDRVQDLFTTRYLRVYTSPDLRGVELAGAMKNVIAIAAGMLDGLRAGNNAKSALLARGLAEITRLGVAMGASAETFFGIAGVGDLATSCFSPEGRNRTCGEALGRGVTLAEHLRRTRSVVEGVATTRSVMDLARQYRVEMPITASVHGVLFEGVDPIDALTQLLSRNPKAERVG